MKQLYHGSTIIVEHRLHCAFYIYVMELKFANNEKLTTAEKQIKSNNQYIELFREDKKREVIGLAMKLEDMGKGLLDWKIGE